jgi:hypothetical protein
MASYTAKLGLKKPAGPEYVNVLEDIANNMDRIDKWAGAIQVNDGVFPAAVDLFDGAIVQEKTSGWIWVAQSNGIGGYTRKMIYAPLAAGLISTNQSVPNWVSGLPFPSNNAADFNTNWTGKGGGLGASGLLLPDLTGYFTAPRYRIDMYVNWPSNATGHRTCGWGNVNGTSNFATYGLASQTPVSGISTQQSPIFFYTAAANGGNIRANILLRQNSGGALLVDTSFSVALDLEGSK